MLPLSKSYIVDDWMINEYEAVGGMSGGKGNRSTWRTPGTMSLRPQIPHVLTWDGTRAADVGSPRLTF
jgi:hypothetical protein